MRGEEGRERGKGGRGEREGERKGRVGREKWSDTRHAGEMKSTLEHTSDPVCNVLSASAELTIAGWPASEWILARTLHAEAPT